MKSIAIIFAGGSGVRMNTVAKPKQFLELHGKPIIVYTLEQFDSHIDIDGIIVVCVERWIPYLKKLTRKFDLDKVVDIVPGGETGQDSIYNGLKAASEHYATDSIVLIHDGVRPLLDEQTISENIRTVKEQGSCITCIATTETFIVKQESGFLEIPKRSESLIARAPQSFILSDILAAHEKARSEEKHDFIDSCTMMNHYGHKLSTIIGPTENIKITTPTDFFIFRAIDEVRENKQIFGF
jgi:2-C-methyl-D-erythritol 4-phosphate cytidylyltransferase